MAQYTYPPQEEVTFPDPETVTSEEIAEFETTDEADTFVNDLISAAGTSDIMTAPGKLVDPEAANGPVYELVVTVAVLVGTVVRYVVHRILYWLTTPRATA